MMIQKQIIIHNNKYMHRYYLGILIFLFHFNTNNNDINAEIRREH